MLETTRPLTGSLEQQFSPRWPAGGGGAGLLSPPIPAISYLLPPRTFRHGPFSVPASDYAPCPFPLAGHSTVCRMLSETGSLIFENGSGSRCCGSMPWHLGCPIGVCHNLSARCGRLVPANLLSGAGRFSSQEGCFALNVPNHVSCLCYRWHPQALVRFRFYFPCSSSSSSSFHFSL